MELAEQDDWTTKSLVVRAEYLMRWAWPPVTSPMVQCLQVCGYLAANEFDDEEPLKVGSFLFQPGEEVRRWASLETETEWMKIKIQKVA